MRPQKVVTEAPDSGVPIKDNAALRGADIGRVWRGVVLEVDLDSLVDGWVTIVGPGGLGPTWKATGKQGWIELSHTTPVVDEVVKYELTVSAKTGEIVSLIRIK